MFKGAYCGQLHAVAHGITLQCMETSMSDWELDGGGLSPCLLCVDAPMAKC